LLILNVSPQIGKCTPRGYLHHSLGSPVLVSQPWVCDIPGAHLQVEMARAAEDERADRWRYF